MIRPRRQGQYTSPAHPGPDQSCGALPRHIGWDGYWDYYYCDPLCFAPRRSRQK